MMAYMLVAIKFISDYIAGINYRKTYNSIVYINLKALAM